MKNANLDKRKADLLDIIKKNTFQINIYHEEIAKLEAISLNIKKRYKYLNNQQMDMWEYQDDISELREIAKKVKKKRNFIKEELEKLIAITREKQNELMTIDYFNREEIFKVIKYLVNKFEKEKYVLKTLPILVAADDSYKYLIDYLVIDDKKNQATLELHKRFSRMIDKSAIEDNNVSNYYLQLAIYKEEDQKEIIFDDLDCKTKPYSYMKSYPIVPHTKIYDTRFSYIYDFLSYLIDKSLDKPDLSLEDMYKLVDEFSEYYLQSTSEKSKIK